MDASDVGRILVILGIVVALFGVLLVVGLPLGRLPGDLTVRGDGWTIYIPIATSILLSLGLTLVFALAAALGRR
jgi:low affinity Fe/Cu permease